MEEKKKGFNWRIFGVVLVIGLMVAVAFVSWYQQPDNPTPPIPLLKTPYPTETDTVADIQMRTIPTNLDPLRQSGMYIRSWANHIDLTPQPRPTYHPLYPSNYPLGSDVLSFMSDNEHPYSIPGLVTWNTAPSGCTDTWCTTSNISWYPIQRQVDIAESRNVKLGDGTTINEPLALNLPSQYLNQQGGVCGLSQSDPCFAVNLPNHLQTYTYTFQDPNGRWFKTLRWDSPVLLARMKQFIFEAAEQYKARPDWQSTIRLVRVYTGLAGETQPVQAKTWTDDDGTATQEQLMKSAEDKLTELITGAPPTSSNKYLGCDKFMIYARTLAEYTQQQFDGLLPVVIMAGTPPCSYANHTSFSAGDKWRYNLQYYSGWGWEMTTPKKPIGFSNNYIAPAFSGFDTCATCLRQSWQWLTTAEGLAGINKPSSFESGYNPGDSSRVEDNWQDQVWAALAGCQVGADYYMQNHLWPPYSSYEMWRVIENCYGDKTSMAFIHFRNSEFTTYKYPSGGNYEGESDYRGTYGNWLRLSNYGDFNQACNPVIKTKADNHYATVTAVAGRTVDRRACPTTLPTPVITPNSTPTPNSPDMVNRIYNRQVLQLENSNDSTRSQFDVVLEADHPNYGQTKNAKVDLVYYDNGTGYIAVNFAATNNTVVQILIHKTNTNRWIESKGNVLSNVVFANNIAGRTEQAFIKVINPDSSDIDYLASIYITPTETGATPTPTTEPTATPIPTPTVTNGFRDPGFEYYTGFQDDGTSDTFTYWVKQNDTSGNVLESSGTRHAGISSLKMTFGGSGNPYVSSSESSAVTPDAYYKLSFYARGDGTASPSYAIYNPCNSSWVVSPWVDTGVSSTTWTQVNANFFAPSNCSEVIAYFGQAESGTGYIDDVSITSAVAPTPTPVSGLLFSEVNTQPAQDYNLSGNINEADRWFELINWTGTSVNIMGYRLTNGGNTFYFTANTTIPAWSRRVFSAEDTLPIATDGTFALYNRTNALVDDLTYTTYPANECIGTWPDGSNGTYGEAYCTPAQPNAAP